MSGAAGIAAAKNRRSRTDPVRPSVVDCKSTNGTCAPKNNNQQQPQSQNRSVPTIENNLIDPISLKILGPMPTPQVLKIHEQRLNKLDEKLNQCMMTKNNPVQQNVISSNASSQEQIELMEDKIRMLEEVIMNLQLTITNVQGFAMETNLAMMKMKREQEEIHHNIENVEVLPNAISHVDDSVESSSPLDVSDIVNNDEIVISNITYALNNGY
jgi:hypothetical protein